jgi:transcriptional regulator with XRE-family HTH domain
MISRYRSCGERVITAAAKFGELVRSTRRAKGLKVWEVAERVDIDAKHLGRIERGEKQPSFDLIMALARVLNVSPSRFFEFDLAEPMALRKQIDLLLKDRNPSELQRAREVLKHVFAP